MGIGGTKNHHVRSARAWRSICVVAGLGVLLFDPSHDRLLVFRAPVAELVDAADSKSVIFADVGVRVSPGAVLIN